MTPEVTQILAYENQRKADLQAYIAGIAPQTEKQIADIQLAANRLTIEMQQRVIEVEQHIAWISATFGS